MNLKLPKKILLYVFLFFIIIPFIVAAFIVFERAIKETVSENSTSFLKETAFLYSGTFQVKLNDQLSMLESQARYFKEIDMNDYNAVKRAIIATKGVGEFKRIAVANSSGMTVNYDGKSSGNILMKEYFKKAMKGMPQISSKIQIDEDGEQVLTLAVPIFQKEETVGVITGTFAYSILDNIFSVDTFGGEGYSFVIDKSGKIIIGNSSQNRLCFEDNVFSFLSRNISLSDFDYFRNDIISNRTGIISYSLGSENRFAVYTPIGQNDWYVVSSVTSDYILSQQNKITKITVSLIVVMLIVFVSVFIIILKLISQNIRVEKDNSRYAINSESSRTLIFEYDFGHKEIEFTGNSDFIFGENLKKLPLSEFSKIEDRIHEDERALFKHLREFVRSGGDTYNSELRLIEEDGKYAWYRISGSLISSEDGKPLKFIGNVVNVNAQVIHEQELKVLAQTDLLSGLLNKMYTEKSIDKFMAMNPDSIFGALYVIDLDNFKQVNDRLGHSFGDNAICDTANKLTLVFSEKDFIGRLGGDEFCVFMCLRSTVPHAEAIVKEKAKTLKSILAECYSNGEDNVDITPSIGISLFPEQGTTFRSLFQKADTALYHVKENGKNNFAIYNNDMKNVGESVYVQN